MSLDAPENAVQLSEPPLFPPLENPSVVPFRQQLLKWVGNKQRFAHEIASYLKPVVGGTYYEPFLGSGAVLATLAPERAVGSDAFKPLVGIWQTLQSDSSQLVDWYASRWSAWSAAADPRSVYESIKQSYNQDPNPADLLFLSRSCYGGVVRFRARDGFMSTPMGPHRPISPVSFSERVEIWRRRTAGSSFQCLDFREAFGLAGEGDVVYCDPPYVHTQAILYGAQSFKFNELLDLIAQAKRRGVRVALSIDGTKRSGAMICDLPLPVGLFEREVMVNCGPSMLKRFQMEGKTLEEHHVSDRLLLTW